MRVLLLEDDGDKARRIVEVLQGVNKTIDIVECGNVASARKSLGESTFDLLILDVRVPFRDGEQPSDDGGVHLLKELLEDNQFLRPKYVLGITGIDEIFAETSQTFLGHGWGLLQYSPTDPKWANSLSYFVSHVLRMGERGIDSEEGADIVIITALEKPEFEALRLVFPELVGPRPVDSRTLIWEGTVKTHAGSVRLVAAVCWQMGLTASAILSEKLLQKFNPSLLAMTGICAGYPDSVGLGDVVVATQSWEWQGGKIASVDGKAELEPAPEPYRAGQELITKLKALESDKAILQDVSKRFFPQDLEKHWSIKFGAMVSGLSVIASRTAMDEVRTQHRKIMALEMEAYAIYAAAHFCADRTEAVVLKGVCDFGDENKNDGYQFLGAVRSALLLRALIEKYQ